MKGVRGLRFGLCFLRAQRTIGGPFAAMLARFAVIERVLVSSGVQLLEDLLVVGHHNLSLRILFIVRLGR